MRVQFRWGVSQQDLNAAAWEPAGALRLYSAARLTASEAFNASAPVMTGGRPAKFRGPHTLGNMHLSSFERTIKIVEAGDHREVIQRCVEQDRFVTAHVLGRSKESHLVRCVPADVLYHVAIARIY